VRGGRADRSHADKSVRITPSAPMFLADVFAPVFEGLFDNGHELIGDSSIDDAMVVTESQVDNGAYSDGIVAIFVSDDEGLLGDAADAHDGGIGLIDDGQAEDGSELAGIGDGESGAFNIGGHEFLVAGALAEIGDAALEAEEVKVVGIFEDGNDKSPIEGDGDAGVDVAVVADALTFDGGVDDRELLDGDDGGAHEEWHEGEAGTMALFEAVLEFVAKVDDASEVHFEHGVDVSAGAAGLDHALRDDLAHLGHGNEITRNGGGGGRRRWLDTRRASRGARQNTIFAPVFYVVEDVLLGDATAGARAMDLG